MAGKPTSHSVCACHSQDFLSHGMDLDSAVAAGAKRATEPWFNVPYTVETVSRARALKYIMNAQRTDLPHACAVERAEVQCGAEFCGKEGA